MQVVTCKLHKTTLAFSTYLIFERYESEPPRALCVSIEHDNSVRDRSVALKVLSELIFSNTWRQSTNENLLGVAYGPTRLRVAVERGGGF